MTTNGDNRSSSDVIGVLFGPSRLDGCRAVQTLWGSVRYQHASVEVANGNLDAALAELLRQLGAGRVSLPIAAAIPTDECYFATRPIASNGTKASPRVLLRESLRSSSARLDQMAIDVMYWQPDRRTVAGICAAPIERIESIRTAVAQSKHSLQRLEPSASCLVGVSPERDGRERRNTLTTRVFLGNSRVLAVMSRGAKPIHWQQIPLPPGDEARGIVSAIRSLETAAHACGLDRTPDVVVIHGRRELQSLTDENWLSESLEGSLRWVETPTLDGAHVAQALADRLLANEDEGFDLVREHRDPLQLHRVVPYKEIAAYIVLACILAGVLWVRLGSIRTQHTALVSSAPPMVAGGANPKSEKNRLSARATSINTFLNKRVRWSGMLGEITQALPNRMRLTGIQGSAPMPKRSKGKTKTLPAVLILQAECALGEDGSMPESLNGLAESLQSLGTVAPHFDSVELGNVRRTQEQGTGIANASFSVIFAAKTNGGR